MNLETSIRFDAASAISAHSHQKRVRIADDQDKLDIAAKQRTSVMPWRGQFSPQLIEHLLEKHTKRGDRVVDPFCGSGTVLYEAAAQRLHANGYDVNPAAVALARFSKVCGTAMADRQTIITQLDGLIRALLNAAQISLGGFQRLVGHLNECFPAEEQDAEDLVLERGFFRSLSELFWFPLLAA